MSAWTIIHLIWSLIMFVVVFWLVVTGRVVSVKGRIQRPDPARGSKYVVPAYVQEQARSLLADGKRLQAIKVIRQGTSLPLQPAMEIAEALRTGATLPIDVAGRPPGGIS